MAGGDWFESLERVIFAVPVLEMTRSDGEGIFRVEGCKDLIPYHVSAHVFRERGVAVSIEIWVVVGSLVGGESDELNFGFKCRGWKAHHFFEVSVLQIFFVCQRGELGECTPEFYRESAFGKCLLPGGGQVRVPRASHVCLWCRLCEGYRIGPVGRGLVVCIW